MVGWHHRLDGHEFEQTQGESEGQEGLACCSPWRRKQSDTTEQLNNKHQQMSQGTTPCSRGTSWSADLDKCMDCASCRARPHSDFCLGCTAAPPAPFRLLWPILGGALGLALVLGLLSGFLVWRRCRRREKFTTPIEETGGESCPGVALIQ
uniref:Tumor necrosis factor receptor superfamily member 12A n=2 Tax=Bos TaxID=9903 RepID=A0AAA9TS17_BOVIN